MSSRMALRASFGAKVLLPMVGVLALLVAAMLWVVNSRIAEQVQNFAADSLRTSRFVLENFRSVRTRDLSARCRAMQNEPRVKATAQLNDPRTMRGLLEELLEEQHLDFLVYGDEAGLPIVTASRAQAAAPDAERPGDALEFTVAPVQTGGAKVLSRAGELFDVAAVPVMIGDHVVGTLTAGLALKDDTARELRRLTGCDVALCAGTHLVASTLDTPAARQEFERSLRALPANHSSEWRLTIAGDRYLALGGTLNRGTAEPAGANYVLLANAGPQLRQLRDTQSLLLALGLAGILLSAACAWLIVRTATRPLRQLRESAEAIGRGEFTQRVAVTSRDELGDLARAFNEMTENLHQSRERLEKTVATLTDTRARLLQSEKLSAIGEFISGVAHELNNPLTVMVGFAGALQDAELPEATKRSLGLISEAAVRCHKIVQNLLSFARQRPPERSLVSVNEILENTVHFLSYELTTGNIAVVRELDHDLPVVPADPHQLQQVFLNIVNNARQAMEEQGSAGTLRLATAVVGKHVRVTIADSGPGIPAAVIERIFDPFFTTKPQGKGTGLGLSVSYGIIKEHGGDLRVESVAGRGAAFIVEIPLATGASPVPTTVARTEPGTGWKVPCPMRAMVIDDEDAILELLRVMLAELGFTVETQREGHAALESLAKTPCELILCDCRMPGLSGQQIYAALRTRLPQLAFRVVFMTGDILNEEVLRAVGATGNPCIAKPFSQAELIQAVKAILARL